METPSTTPNQAAAPAPVPQGNATPAPTPTFGTGAADDGMVDVMEVDSAGDQDVFKREVKEALDKGLPIIDKAEQKKAPEQPAPTPAAPAAPAAEPETPAAKTEEPHPLDLHFSGEPAPPAEVPAAVTEWLKSQGHEVQAVLTELPALRTEKATLTKELEQAKADLAFISKLDPDALNLIQMAADGKDWKNSDVLKRPQFDFRRTAETQDKQKLIDAYAPGKVTPEQMKEYLAEEGDPTTKALVEAVLDTAKLRYNADREDATTYLTKQAEAYQALQKKRADSTEAALQHTYNTIRGSKAYEAELREITTDKAIRSIFYEDDGVTLKPTAASDAWFLKHKDRLMRIKESSIRQQAQDDATLDLVRRTPEKQQKVEREPAPAKTAQQLVDEILADVPSVKKR